MFATGLTSDKIVHLQFQLIMNTSCTIVESIVAGYHSEKNGS